MAPHLGKGMGVALADYDGDGWMDVFVTNDTVPNFLFRNVVADGSRKRAAGWRGRPHPRQGGLQHGCRIPGLRQRWPARHPRDSARRRNFPLFHNDGGGVFSDAPNGPGSRQQRSGAAAGATRWSISTTMAGRISSPRIRTSTIELRRSRHTRIASQTASFENAGGTFRDVSEGGLGPTSSATGPSWRGGRRPEWRRPDGRRHEVARRPSGDLGESEPCGTLDKFVIKLTGTSEPRCDRGAHPHRHSDGGARHDRRICVVVHAGVHFGLGSATTMHASKFAGRTA